MEFGQPIYLGFPKGLLEIIKIQTTIEIAVLDN